MVWASSMQESDCGDRRETIVVAIGEGKNSQHAVKWAVDHLVNEENRCVFVHVALPQSLNDEDSGLKNRARPPTEFEAHQYFLPYRDVCAQKGIKPKEVILEGLQVSSALLDYISTNDVSSLVVGASTRHVITRKFRNASVATNLAAKVSSSCTVHIIAKGKVRSRQPANQLRLPTNVVMPLQHPQAHQLDNTETYIVDSVSPVASSEHSDNEDTLTNRKYLHEKGDQSIRTIGSSYTPESQTSSMVSVPWDGFYSDMVPTPKTSMESVGFPIGNRSTPYHLDTSSYSSGSFGRIRYKTCDASPLGEMYSKAKDPWSLSPSAPSMETELSKMKLALKQTKEKYESACDAAAIVSSQAVPLNACPKKRLEEHVYACPKKRLEEHVYACPKKRLEEHVYACPKKRLEEHVLALDEQAAVKIEALAKLEVERQMREIAGEKARKAQCPERYGISEKTDKVKTTRDVLERKTIMVGCKRYSIDEIEVATDHFSNSLRIGEGGYGPVFKGTLDDADVAIKIRRPDISQGPKQFQKEVDILSCMKHPHMVRLVGACPEYGCLVYEYLENGSLEDRLFRKDDTPPIPWKSRFRMASEISTALLFLHQAKPEPLVHRDLKPANILLDRNYAAKISDVGLARLLPAPAADNMSNYQMTDAAGTFCYIDPEYQQTGRLGVKSDVYSLGIILLQIITAKPAMGLTHFVEGAIEAGTFSEILDPTIADWPLEETLSFAKLALKCCELSKKDRPDLCSVVVPELNRIRDIWMDTGSHLERRSSLPSDSSCQFPPAKQVRIQLGFRVNAKSRWKKIRNRWSLLAACSTNTNLQTAITNTKQMDFNCWTCSFSNRNLIRDEMEKMPSHKI